MLAVQQHMVTVGCELRFAVDLDDPGAAEDVHTIEPILDEGVDELRDPFVARVAPPAVGRNRHIGDLQNGALADNLRRNRLVAEELQCLSPHLHCAHPNRTPT